MPMNRRDLLKVGLGSLAYYSLEATTPNWVIRSAHALAGDCFGSTDRILVIFQQAGGNDGLNTLIPRSDPIYYDSGTRPNLQIPFRSETVLDSISGLHPRLPQPADPLHSGHTAAVHHVR